MLEHVHRGHHVESIPQLRSVQVSRLENQCASIARDVSRGHCRLNSETLHAGREHGKKRSRSATNIQHPSHDLLRNHFKHLSVAKPIGIVNAAVTVSRERLVVMGESQGVE